MTVNEAHTELLFSYGTLQLEAVQMATFGRQLAGTSDALRGFEQVLLKIENQTVVAISGKAHHTMAKFTGRASDVVCGICRCGFLRRSARSRYHAGNRHPRAESGDDAWSLREAYCISRFRYQCARYHWLISLCNRAHSDSCVSS